MTAWRTAWRDYRDPPDLKRSEGLARFKAVGYALATRWDRDGLSAYPAPALLALDAGCSEAQAKRALKALERSRWIVCTERGGGRRKTSKYDATLPQSVSRVPGFTAETLLVLQERVSPGIKRVSTSSRNSVPLTPEVVREEVRKSPDDFAHEQEQQPAELIDVQALVESLAATNLLPRTRPLAA